MKNEQEMVYVKINFHRDKTFLYMLTKPMEFNGHNKLSNRFIPES